MVAAEAVEEEAVAAAGRRRHLCRRLLRAAEAAAAVGGLEGEGEGGLLSMAVAGVTVVDAGVGGAVDLAGVGEGVGEGAAEEATAAAVAAAGRTDVPLARVHPPCCVHCLTHQWTHQTATNAHNTSLPGLISSARRPRIVVRCSRIDPSPFHQILCRILDPMPFRVFRLLV